MNAVNPVSVRIPAELKQWIEAKASNEGRSLNRQIVQIIKAAKASEGLQEASQ